MSSKPIGGADLAERQRIGASIKSFRQMRGFKPDEFACEINISRPYLANIEAGRKPLTEVLLARIADALSIPQIAIVRDGFFNPEADAA